MKRMENKMDELFKSQLNNLTEEQPSEMDWAALKSELNKEGLINKNNNKRKIFFWSFTALLLIGVGLFAFYNQTKTAASAVTIVAKQSPEKDQVLLVEKEQLSEKKSEGTFNKKQQQITIENKESEKSSSNVKTEIQEVPEKSNSKVPSVSKKITLVKSNSKTSEKEKSHKVQSISVGGMQTREEDKTNVEVEKNVVAQIAAEETTANPTEEIKSLALTTPSATIATTAVGVETSATAVADSISTVAQIDTPATEIKKEEDILDKTVYRKFWGGALVSLDYNDYTLKYNTTDGKYISPENKDESRFQYSAGIGVGYRHSKLFGISAEVLYSQKKSLHLSGSAPDTSGSDANGNQYHYNIEAKYLDVIVKPRIYVWHKKFSAYVFPGFVTSFNLPGWDGKSYFTKTQITADGYVQDKINLEFFSAGFSLLAGAGIEYDLKNNWKIMGEISYRQSLTPLIQHSSYTVPLSHYLYSVNAGIGVCRYF